MSAALVMSGVLVAAASGVPALLMSRASDAGQRIAAALQLLAAALAVGGASAALAGAGAAAIEVPLSPLLPSLAFGLDALSAAFVIPAGILCACSAVFDLGYWRQARHPENGRRVRVFAGLLTASLFAIPAAQDAIAFLVAWEVMAVAAFFLVSAEERDPQVRRAGWIFLAASHASTLALFAFFCCWSRAAGTFALTPPPGSIPGEWCGPLFALGLLAFGLKAGIVPLHFWLPPAHASAPSHVSAVMSGVLIKLGVYGVARCAWLLDNLAAEWGIALIALGATSAVVGVALAIGQHDLKRLLAYHSIENIGIIFLGLGLAVVGRASGHADLVVLGVCGGVLHVWNHALFKGLLFLAAGATIHRVGTREIDQLGGLAHAMPATAASFLVGAVAISGLPPLNGFVSELLLYVGLFRALGGAPHVAVAAAAGSVALAAAGAMALLCFVKVFGVAYLGRPRTPAARQAHENGAALLAPLAVLAAACIGIGLVPIATAPALAAVAAGFLPGAAAPGLAELVPLIGVGLLATGLAGALLLGWCWLRRAARAPASVGTWDCGYLGSTAAMQTSASSFAQPFVGLCRWLLQPRPRRLPSCEGLFAAPLRLHTDVPDPVLDRLLLPALNGLAAACTWLRLLQRGRVHVYLLYILLTLSVLLLLR